MFGNNINNPFAMSNIYSPGIMNHSMIQGIPITGNTMIRSTPMINSINRGGNLLNSLFRGRTGLSQGLHSFNFGNLLNNTSKALGVVRDAIPIVKEVSPMIGNMKQMLKIASIFKDETDTVANISNTSTNSTTIEKIKSKENDTNIISTTTNQNNNEPNFFL